jgi:Phosphodiester glycosidase/Purple acid Phosphatase, N-terminal domain
MQNSIMPIKLSLILALLMGVTQAQATTFIGSWTPLFKGVDHSVSTNIPSGGDFPNLHVVHALRVDLADPDIRLLTTPRISDYVADVREIGALTVSDFLQTYHVQAAINANFFDARNYYLAAGTPMDVFGLAISEGVVVSAQDGPDYASTLVFDAGNRAMVIHTNWPGTNVDGVFTAVSGEYSLVIGGKNVADDLPNRGFIHEVNPRTVFGLSQDRRFLYLVTIDGRQPGYSDGADDYESAGWLLLLGAYDGVNLDGGGSTTLVVEDSTGVPVRLNQSSAVADSGRERTVGSHFGLFAKPLPGFINNVVASPEDTSVKITWTTVEPSSTQVQYGVTTDFGNNSEVQATSVTNHIVQLTGLTPATGYYFRAISSVGPKQYVSSNFFFITTNYVTTNQVFALSNSWTYTVDNPDGLDWTTLDFDDSNWSGPGSGLLWVDVRSAGPNPSVEPKNTQMPADPNTGYPYVTYYFRSRFVLTNLVQASSLAFSCYIDDGAVFYLNGSEIYRMRMPDSSDAETLATGYPCEGDATCADEFTIPVESINLAVGENILAVEVHNYSPRSADITFGLSLNRIEPLARTAQLSITRSSMSIILSWEANGFVLQSANSPEGPWIDVGTAAKSPFTEAITPSSRYYRLRK